MAAPFDALGERLLRAGVAPRHVKRYMRELGDHLADLMDREMSSGHDANTSFLRAKASLGEDETLADAVLLRPDSRSLAARAPWVVFIALPPIILFAVMWLPVLLLSTLEKVYNFVSGTLMVPQWFQEFSQFVIHGSNLVLMPMVAAGFATLAFRQRLPVRWSALATIAILVLFIRLGVHFPERGRCGGILNVEVLPVFCQTARDAISAKWGEVGGSWVFAIIPTAWLYFSRRIHFATH